MDKINGKNASIEETASNYATRIYNCLKNLKFPSCEFNYNGPINIEYNEECMDKISTSKNLTTMMESKPKEFDVYSCYPHHFTIDDRDKTPCAYPSTMREFYIFGDTNIDAKKFIEKRKGIKLEVIKMRNIKSIIKQWEFKLIDVICDNKEEKRQEILKEDSFYNYVSDTIKTLNVTLESKGYSNIMHESKLDRYTEDETDGKIVKLDKEYEELIKKLRKYTSSVETLLELYSPDSESEKIITALQEYGILNENKFFKMYRYDEIVKFLDETVR